MHGVMDSFFFPAANGMGYGNTGADGKTDEEIDHEIGNGTGCTYCSYGKTAAEACEIGTRLAASVIVTDENVCPRFLPAEFGLDVDKL